MKVEKQIGVFMWMSSPAVLPFYCGYVLGMLPFRHPGASSQQQTARVCSSQRRPLNRLVQPNEAVGADAKEPVPSLSLSDCIPSLTLRCRKQTKLVRLQSGKRLTKVGRWLMWLWRYFLFTFASCCHQRSECLVIGEKEAG